jgi:hypothetical protein
MLYSTYLGSEASDARDDTYGIALDARGRILATGRTVSSGFPMTAATVPSIYNTAPYLKPHAAGDEPYLVKIDPALSGQASLVYSTFLGGGSTDNQWASFGVAIGVSAQGAAYVGGETAAPGTPYVFSSHATEAPNDFPYTADALITSLQGDSDAMLMQVSADGGSLDYSTYLGGTGRNSTYGLAVDPKGNVVVTGATTAADFPVKNPAQKWPGVAGGQNAFVSKFSFAP